MDKLNQLASLHTAGVLSDDEFASAKAKLLAS
ncbi:SHOCT domain-containing protein [Rhizobium johnstonii]